jgi:hypothetical protein
MDETEFVFSQDGRVIHARYGGGTIAVGFLAGVADGDTLEFRYVHVDRGARSPAGARVTRSKSCPTAACVCTSVGSGNRRRAAGRAFLRRSPDD